VTGPLRHGQPWGRPATAPADLEFAGGDADLAEAAARHPGALVRFRPSPESDLARALGLGPDATGATEVTLDALALEEADELGVATAVNAVVVGPAPDRVRWTTRSSSITVTVDGRASFAGAATTVVVASGQFLRGADLVPRGHPGDGWAEVQVYALARRERRPMRRRLTSGTHVPHAHIHTARARRVEIDVDRAVPLEVDGHARGKTRRVVVTLVPEAIRILI
jgi:YegS C-terminal NAD kinase beta sandwich-like domain